MMNGLVVLIVISFPLIHVSHHMQQWGAAVIWFECLKRRSQWTPLWLSDRVRAEAERRERTQEEEEEVEEEDSVQHSDWIHSR